MVDHASDGQVHGQAFFKASREAPGGNPSVGRIIGPMGSAILGSGVDSLGPSVGQQQTISAAVRAVAQGQYQATEKALTPYRQEQVLKGMQAVAMGQTINQVAAERPAYATLFGDTDATLGAKLYAKATKGQEVLKNIQEAMPELRKLGPDQARQAILGHVNSVQTGDPAVDTEVQTKLMESFPGLMDTYTKQAIQYQQERLSASQRGFMDMAGREVQASMYNASMTGESKADLDRALSSVARWDQAVAPLPGQHPEVWQENIIRSLKTQIDAIGEQEMVPGPEGKMVLRTKGVHGIFAILHHSETVKGLPEDVRQNLLDAAEKAALQAAPKFMLPYADEVAHLKARIAHPGPGDNVNLMLKDLQRISEDVQRGFGSPFPLFDAQDQVSMSSSMAVAIAKKKEEQEAKRLQDLRDLQKEARERYGRRAELMEIKQMELMLKQQEALQNKVQLQNDPVAFEQRVAVGAISSKDQQAAYQGVFLDPEVAPEAKDRMIRNSSVVPKAAEAYYAPGIREVLTRPLEEATKSADQFVGAVSTFSGLMTKFTPDKVSQLVGGPDNFKALKAAQQAAAMGGSPKEIAAAAYNTKRGYVPPRASNESLKWAKAAAATQAGWGFFGILLNKDKGTSALAGKSLEESNNAFYAAVATRAEELAQQSNTPVEDNMSVAIQQLTGGPNPEFMNIKGVMAPSLFVGERSFKDALVHPNEGTGVPLDKVDDAMDWAIKKQLERYRGYEAVEVLHQSGSSTVPHMTLRIRGVAGGIQKVDITDRDVLDAYLEEKEGSSGPMHPKVTGQKVGNQSDIQKAVREGLGSLQGPVWTK